MRVEFGAPHYGLALAYDRDNRPAPGSDLAMSPGHANAFRVRVLEHSDPRLPSFPAARRINVDDELSRSPTPWVVLLPAIPPISTLLLRAASSSCCVHGLGEVFP